MTENKRVTVDFDSESYYLDGEYWESWDNYGEEMAEEINKLLDKQDKRIIELEDKLNQTALEFLNHELITMGKAVEISEMSYYDFISYRAEHGNPMELQL